MQYASKFGKLISCHRTGKSQFSFQCQRRAMPKNVQITTNCTHFACYQRNGQNFPSETSIVCQSRNSSSLSWIQKRQKNQRSNGQHLLDHRKSKRIPENMHFCFIDYAKAFDCVDHSKLWKILQQMGIPDHLTCLLRNLCASQEATVRTGLKQWNNGLVSNWERSKSRLHTITLLI